MAAKPKTMRFDADAEVAIKAEESAKREAALAFDTPIPAGEGPFYVARPEDLKLLDLERSLVPGWFQSERRIGYVFYVDRFAGTLAGIKERLPYLRAFGANYLHLMPLLKPRPGPNDGGYAVEDYRSVDPRLGTMDDLEALCATLRAEGVSVCLDLVLNHCAREHEWAVKARNGVREYLEMFHTFPDRTLPDEYERALPEVLPETAPGNFTYVEELDRWVWTSFAGYQWDLNWSNPRVFLEMTDVLLYLANRGVEVFRLDAVAFMWKRPGTDCQNQPEVHDLLQALRACSRISAPAVAHKAEAIVSPPSIRTRASRTMFPITLLVVICSTSSSDVMRSTPAR